MTVTPVTVTVTTVIMAVTAVIMTMTSVLMTVTAVIMTVTPVMVTVTTVTMTMTLVIMTVTSVIMTVTTVTVAVTAVIMTMTAVMEPVKAGWSTSSVEASRSLLSPAPISWHSHVPNRHLAWGSRNRRPSEKRTVRLDEVSSEDVIARGQGVTVFIQYNGTAACLFRPKTVGTVCA